MTEENRITDLEAEVNDLKEQIKQLEQSVSQKKRVSKGSRTVKRSRDRDNYFWGFVLIIVGGLWFAKNVGWFCCDISIWPAVIIAVGIYLLFSSPRSKSKELYDD